MQITWYANIGTDAAPTWIEITDNMRIHFTGAGSVPNSAKPVVRPDNGYVWPEEVWIGPEVMATGQQVNSWEKPSSAIQNGKVFKMVFAERVGAAPFLSAYDTPEFDTWDDIMLAGTEQTNWTGLIKAFIAGRESANTPPAQGWAVKETGGSGSRNPNGLQGNAAIVSVPFIPLAGDDFTFTIAPSVPSDAEAGKEGKYDPKLTITFVHV